MPRDGLEGILGARWVKAAMPGWADQKNLGGREHALIHAHSKNYRMLDGIHLGPFNNPALRNVVKKSRSTSANRFPAIEGRATRTKSTGEPSSDRCNRKLSRNSRRARLRATAAPTFLEVITPSRESAFATSRRQLAMRHPVTMRSPSRRTRANSRACLSRVARPNPRPRGVPAPIRCFKPASNACVPRGADCAEPRGRSCSNCGSRNRVAACGESSTVDIVAS